jgi:uncharacterized membrane protein YtjA (UPF0391 family)
MLQGGGRSVGNVLRREVPPHRLCKRDAARKLRHVVREVFHTYTGALMLHYAVVFFVIALVAAFFGFGGIAVGAAGIAKVLFVVFLIGAVISFLMSMGRRV